MPIPNQSLQRDKAPTIDLDYPGPTFRAEGHVWGLPIPCGWKGGVERILNINPGAPSWTTNNNQGGDMT